MVSFNPNAPRVTQRQVLDGDLGDSRIHSDRARGQLQEEQAQSLDARSLRLEAGDAFTSADGERFRVYSLVDEESGTKLDSFSVTLNNNSGSLRENSTELRGSISRFIELQDTAKSWSDAITRRMEGGETNIYLKPEALEQYSARDLQIIDAEVSSLQPTVANRELRRLLNQEIARKGGIPDTTLGDAPKLEDRPLADDPLRRPEVALTIQAVGVPQSRWIPASEWSPPKDLDRALLEKHARAEQSHGRFLVQSDTIVKPSDVPESQRINGNNGYYREYKIVTQNGQEVASFYTPDIVSNPDERMVLDAQKVEALNHQVKLKRIAEEWAQRYLTHTERTGTEPTKLNRRHTDKLSISDLQALKGEIRFGENDLSDEQREKFCALLETRIRERTSINESELWLPSQYNHPDESYVSSMLSQKHAMNLHIQPGRFGERDTCIASYFNGQEAFRFEVPAIDSDSREYHASVARGIRDHIPGIGKE